MTQADDDVPSHTSDNIALQLLSMVNKLRDEFIAHTLVEEKKMLVLQQTIERLEAKADRFLTAFPDGGTEAHRLYHALLINKLKFRAAFWNKMCYELTKYGLLGFLLWAGYALWKAFLMGPK